MGDAFGESSRTPALRRPGEGISKGRVRRDLDAGNRIVTNVHVVEGGGSSGGVGVKLLDARPLLNNIQASRDGILWLKIRRAMSENIRNEGSNGSELG